MPDKYRRFRFSSSGELERECLLAEAFEAGAEGAEEREEQGRFDAWVYASAARINQIRERLSIAASDTTEIGASEDLPLVNWNEAWKEGLKAIPISNRLLIRPPFIEATLKPGQKEIVINPGQAFGTGGHASTRLCLDWIDQLIPAPAAASHTPAFGRVVDVGTGSGILALAAVALGADSAIGFDLDPVAIEAAKAAALENCLADKTHFYAGPIEALREYDGGAPLVLANLLKQEMLPIASQIASCLHPSGHLVLAGLLKEDVAEVKERFAKEGLREVGRLHLQDSIGEWIGLCLAFQSC